MSSNDNISEMQRKRGEPVPGFPGMTWGSISLERPPMVRRVNDEGNTAWKAKRDQLCKSISQPSSVETEDLSSDSWLSALAIEDTKAFRDHEEAVQRKVCLEGADESLLVLQEGYKKAEKELDAEKSKTF
jgi:hypothetical protein